MGYQLVEVIHVAQMAVVTMAVIQVEVVMEVAEPL